MDKEDVIHIYNGIILSHWKEWDNAICNKMNRLPPHVGSSWTRDWIHISCSGRRILHHWATRGAALLLSSCSVVSDSLQPHGLQHPRLPCPSASPGLCSNSCPLKSVMPSKHLTLCCPLLHLPSIFPSIRVFSNESALCIKWPKYWSFSTGSSNEYSGSISFRIDCF